MPIQDKFYIFIFQHDRKSNAIKHKQLQGQAECNDNKCSDKIGAANATRG